MLGIQLGLSSKGEIYERSAYSLYDWLRDCGGFTFAILFILQSFMPLYSKREYTIDLTSSLYKVRDRQSSSDNQLVSEPEQETPRDPSEQQPTQLRKKDVSNIIKQMLDHIPLRLPFCNCGKKKLRLQSLERKAQAMTDDNLDVQTIIKRQLRLERIIRVLFGSK